MAREVRIWTRKSEPQNDDDKENDMSFPLVGDASETELDPAQEKAVASALSALEPHADHIGIGGVLGRLRGLQNDDSDEAFEKAMAEITVTREAIAKSEMPGTPELLQRLSKADEELKVGYLSRHSASPAATAVSRAAIQKAESSSLAASAR